MSRLSIIGWTALAAIILVSVWGLFVVPADALQGEVQRLLYVHVPAAWVMMLAFFVAFLMSILYLVQRKPEWDLLALSAVEIGLLCTVLTLVLGSLWARPTWGVWWEWDPRLTTTALLLPIYGAYLIVRSLGTDPAARARASAVIGVLGFVQVPIVYLSVFWWRSLHQPPSSPRSMATLFGTVMLLAFAAYTLAFAYLWVRRYRVAKEELAYELAGPGEATVEGR